MKHVDLSTEFGEAVPQFLDERLDPFRTVFTEPTWRHASVLAMGALLAPGKRTVSSCLRITGNASANPSVPSTRFSIAPSGNRVNCREYFSNFS